MTIFLVTPAVQCLSFTNYSIEIMYVKILILAVMMIHVVTPTKDRPNHRCSKNHVKSGERNILQISLSLKSKFTCVFHVYVDLKDSKSNKFSNYATLILLCNNATIIQQNYTDNNNNVILYYTKLSRYSRKDLLYCPCSHTARSLGAAASYSLAQKGPVCD
jgi:hypothetical protein